MKNSCICKNNNTCMKDFFFFFNHDSHDEKSHGQSSREKEKPSELSKPSHMISGPEGKINAFSSPFIAVLLELQALVQD